MGWYDDIFADEIIEQFVNKYFGKMDEAKLSECINHIRTLNIEEDYICDHKITLVPDKKSIEDYVPLIRKNWELVTEYNYCISKGIKIEDAFAITEFVRMGKSNKSRVARFSKKLNEYVELLREHQVDEWFIDSCSKI